MARWTLAPLANSDNILVIRNEMNRRLEELNLILSEVEQTDSRVDTLESKPVTQAVTAHEFALLKQQVAAIQETLKAAKILRA